MKQFLRACALKLLRPFYRWHADRVSWMWDRGVFSVFCMRSSDLVLHLCCGDGFFTRHFYSRRAFEVVGADADPVAIAHAKRYNHAKNVRYEVVDIRKSLPSGAFDHVVWDGIGHFTAGEIADILTRLKGQLRDGGIISGYTMQENTAVGRFNSTLEYEFSSKDDVARFFAPHFKNVIVFGTIYRDRHNLHFMASDGPLPFDAEWPRSRRIKSSAAVPQRKHQMVAARDLKPGMLIELNGKFHEVDRTNFCDGTTEQMRLWSGDNIKTATALRIHLVDGRSLLSHPASTVTTLDPSPASGH